MLRKEKGRGQKLLMRYDGPFEILQKISPVTYRIRLPASYGINPIINIEHLEAYHESPPELGIRPQKKMNRGDFNKFVEFDVDKIVGESWKKGRNGKRIPIYRTRYLGYGPEDDQWLTKTDLTNAPLVLEDWQKEKRRKRNNASKTK